MSVYLIDHSLWNRANSVKNGTNCHELDNILACYSGFATLIRKYGNEAHQEKFQAADKRLRSFVVKEERIFLDQKVKCMKEILDNR